MSKLDKNLSGKQTKNVFFFFFFLCSDSNLWKALIPNVGQDIAMPRITIVRNKTQQCIPGLESIVLNAELATIHLYTISKSPPLSPSRIHWPNEIATYNARGRNSLSQFHVSQNCAKNNREGLREGLERYL